MAKSSSGRSGGGSSSSKGGGSRSADKSSSGKSSGRGYSTNSPSAANFARPAGQDARVDRNRQAAATYAAQAAERDGTPIPGHLREYLPGGSAYDPARNRETVIGRVMGGVSDALGRVVGGATGAVDRLLGGDRGPRPAAREESLAPSRSRIPVARGSEVLARGLGGRAVDFVQGRRPLVGLGGVLNFEGVARGSPSPSFDRLYSGGSDRSSGSGFTIDDYLAPTARPGPMIDYSSLRAPEGMDPALFAMLLQQAQAGNPQVLAPYFPGLFGQAVAAASPLQAGIGSLVPTGAPASSGIV